VHIGATEVEISDLWVWEKSHFEKTGFKDLYCKIPHMSTWKHC